MEQSHDELPNEVLEKMKSFDDALGEVEDVFKPFLKIPITDIREKVSEQV